MAQPMRRKHVFLPNATIAGKEVISDTSEFYRAFAIYFTNAHTRLVATASNIMLRHGKAR